jgi:hypothetical protein
VEIKIKSNILEFSHKTNNTRFVPRCPGWCSNPPKYSPRRRPISHKADHLIPFLEHTAECGCILRTLKIVILILSQSAQAYCCSCGYTHVSLPSSLSKFLPLQTLL